MGRTPREHRIAGGPPRWPMSRSRTGAAASLPSPSASAADPASVPRPGWSRGRLRAAPRLRAQWWRAGFLLICAPRGWAPRPWSPDLMVGCNRSAVRLSGGECRAVHPRNSLGQSSGRQGPGAGLCTCRGTIRRAHQAQGCQGIFKSYLFHNLPRQSSNVTHSETPCNDPGCRVGNDFSATTFNTKVSCGIPESWNQARDFSSTR